MATTQMQSTATKLPKQSLGQLIWLIGLLIKCPFQVSIPSQVHKKSRRAKSLNVLCDVGLLETLVSLAGCRATIG